MNNYTIKLGQYIVSFYLPLSIDTDIVTILSQEQKLQDLDQESLINELNKLGCIDISISLENQSQKTQNGVCKCNWRN